MYYMYPIYTYLQTYMYIAFLGLCLFMILCTFVLWRMKRSAALGPGFARYKGWVAIYFPRQNRVRSFLSPGAIWMQELCFIMDWLKCLEAVIWLNERGADGAMEEWGPVWIEPFSDPFNARCHLVNVQLIHDICGQIRYCNQMDVQCCWA